MISPRVRNAWVMPREPPPTVPFHRKVPWWETAPVLEEMTDEHYRRGVYWEIALGFEEGAEKLPARQFNKEET